MASGNTKQKYIDGVNGYNGNPMAEAATPEAMERYRAGIEDSINSGRRARKLMAASPALWKSNAVGEGANRLATGAKKAAPKISAHFADWAQTYQQASDAAKSVSGTGEEAAMEKVRTVYRLFKQKAGKSL